MEKTQSGGMVGNIGSDMEASILSAHKKFFEGSAESRWYTGSAETVLYDTVIRYFTGNS